MQTITARFVAFSKLFLLKTKYLLILFSFFVYLANPSLVAADFFKVISPADISIETPFEVNLEISLQPNSDYFIKARIGKEISNLKNGQTYSDAKGVWLSDSVSWTSFPSFKTDSNGYWSGKIKVQSSKNSELGANLLVIRTRAADNSLSNSPAYSINVLAAEVEEVKPAVTPPVVKVGNPVLNEFMPQPVTGGKEWVEIKNKGGEADLSGWKIDDEVGKSTPQVLGPGTIIPAGGFLVVTFDSSKLNDLADSVRLLKPDDSVVETFTYSKTSRGQAWAKDTTGNWFLTDVATPNAENIIPVVAGSQSQTPKQTSQTTSNQSSTDEGDPSITTTKLPQVLGSKSTKIATVSSSFTKKNGTSATTPLIILGSLLLIGSGVYLIKKKVKSGQSEISDQPL